MTILTNKTICIIGLGYVGLPLACQVAAKGYTVYGFDVNKEIVDKTNAGICHIKDDELQQKLSQVKGKLKATTDASILKQCNVIIICVPTPVYHNFSPNLEYIKSSAEAIAKHIKKGDLVVIESTIYPGTIEEVVLPIIEKSGLKASCDFYLAHCPERIDPGNKRWTIANLPRVVGATTLEGTEAAHTFYSSIIDAPITKLSSVKAAEATKIVENTFRDVNIAFVNELAKSFDMMNIDVVEVIKGAATKPFAFLPHFPGAGVGGHCFDKHEWIFVKINDAVHTVKIGELYELIKYYNCTEIGNTHLVNPGILEVLSFDLETKKPCYKHVRLLSKRPYNKMLQIKASSGYSIRVTDKHPVVVFEDNKMKVKSADELTTNDRLVISTELPEINESLRIDILEHIDTELAKKIRVKLVNGSFSDYKKELSIYISDYKYHDDFFRYDSLPLSYYLKAENALKISRENIYLCTGRGPSLKKIKAIIEFDEDFCRLLGYYLSEGCLTEDKTLRLRFTFNVKESEYINDLKQILDKNGFIYSEYIKETDHAHHIKVSSELLGILFRDVLRTGTNCYTMTIPPRIFSLSKRLRSEIIKGVIRGDGGVTHINRKRVYTKLQKKYFHNNNRMDASYFTSSSVLKQQIMLIAHENDLVPKLQIREGLLSFHGQKNATILQELFLGEKQQKVQQYLDNIRKINTFKQIQKYDNFATISINSIEPYQGDYVYSLEVEDTATIVTTNGLVMHNCISIDPYYLIERAKENGFTHNFLVLAREINNSMPHYTIQRTIAGLNQINKSVKGTKITVLGVSYKPNVDDHRESPAFKVIEELKKLGAVLQVYDPYLPKFSTVKTLQEALQAECLIIVTAHKEFLEMNTEQTKSAGVKLIIDGRNCLDKDKIKSLGIVYKGIGRS